METKKELKEIENLQKEIKILREQIRNVDVEDTENLIKNIRMQKLNSQKINYRKRKINILEGFAPTIY